MYEISNSIKQMTVWADRIKEFENSKNQFVDNGLKVNKFLGFEFGKELSLMYTLYQDYKYSFMTRYERILLALEKNINSEEV